MKECRTAAILLIGDELLSGSVKDENLAYLAKQLERIGIRVRECRIVPDIEDEIVSAVNYLRQRYDFLFTTGGVGPTHDDITSDAIAKAFKVENVIQQPVYDLLDHYLREKGVEFTKATQRMAHAPQGAEVLHTKHSIIPGYRIDNVFVMAGVPRIMRLMFESAIGHLEVGQAILSKEVHANIGEGEIAAELARIEQAYAGIQIGSYPQDSDSIRSHYRVVLVVKGLEENVIDTACAEIVKVCESRQAEAVQVNFSDQ